MAKGEKNFSSDGQKIVRYESTPPPVADYSFKVRASKVTVAKADGPNKVPYINGLVLELLNTANKEGGKNRTLYHSLFLRTDPDADGHAAVNRGDGLVAFSRSIGMKFDLPVIPSKRQNKEGDVVECAILSPQRVADWLKGLDGAVGKVHTKTRPDKNDPSKKYGAVDYFIEGEVEADEEDEDEDDEDEAAADDSDDDEDEDEAESDDEDTDEDEEEAPKKSKVLQPGEKKKKSKK